MLSSTQHDTPSAFFRRVVIRAIGALPAAYAARTGIEEMYIPHPQKAAKCMRASSPARHGIGVCSRIQPTVAHLDLRAECGYIE
jgi:hypothetical protein